MKLFYKIKTLIDVMKNIGNYGGKMNGLIELAKCGDKDAFTELIYLIRQDMYKIARLRLSCVDDIEDAMQETMIEAFKSIKNLKKIENFKSWIFKILINKCNKIYKKRKRYNVSFEELNLENYLTLNQTDNYEHEIEFYQMLKVLNYDEKLVILLFYKEDYSISVISKILNVNENTIKTRLRRAKEKIKVSYERGEING